MVDRFALVNEARAWLGTPWVHLGRARGVGVDCIGLIGMAALACGVAGAAEWRADPTMHNYGRSPKPDFLHAACERFMVRITLDQADVGDVLVQAFRRYPQHFALISRARRSHVIHAYQSIGRVTENGPLLSGARIVAAYRFRGVA